MDRIARSSMHAFAHMRLRTPLHALLVHKVLQELLPWLQVRRSTRGRERAPNMQVMTRITTSLGTRRRLSSCKPASVRLEQLAPWLVYYIGDR